MGNAINLESDSEMQDEAVTVWNIIPDEVLVHVLSYIPAKEVARAGTVNKQFCVCSYNNSLWKKKFYEDYQFDKPLNRMTRREAEYEENFRELLDLEHPEHYVLTDWRRGYITKIKYETTQERLQCFSNCLPLSHQGVPFLNSHNIPSYAFQPHLFEQVEPLKIERIFSKREDRNKSNPLTPNDKGLAIYENLFLQDPQKQDLIWLVVDGAKHPSIVPKIQESETVLSISLFGKWFNQTNTNNFPFLVKFNSDPELSKWIFTYGYDKSAVLVFFVAPNLSNNVANEWYLAGYEKTMALMLHIKRHLGQFFTLDRSGFCWIYDPTVMYSLLLTFHSSFTNSLFYTIKSKGIFVDTKFPVVDAIMVFGGGFCPGELPDEPYLIKRDQKVPGCRKFAATPDKINRGMALHIEERLIFKAATVITHQNWQSMSQSDKHRYLLTAKSMADRFKIVAAMYSKFLSIFNLSPGEFWNVPEFFSVLNNTAILTNKRLDDVLNEKN
jgi:hypothetical protein